MMRENKEKRHKTSPSPTQICQINFSNLPLDLTVEVLKKLPSKSLIRFQCVSKLWSSIISTRRDFIDSIVSRSSTQPPCDAYLLFYNLPGSHMECSLSLSSTTHKIPLLSINDKLRQYVRGLIFWSDVDSLEGGIYNPTTRQSFYLHSTSPGRFLFGYDPLEDQYKVVFLSSTMDKSCQVFTLGDPTGKQWRTIQGVGSNHYPLLGAIFINGAIYYQALIQGDDSYRLMSFDVKSEEFCYVDAPKTLMDHVSTLINYQGKLGFVCCQKRMEIWVREDCERWSKIFFYEMDGFEEWLITGATRGGDIVLVNSEYLSVFYYDPKRNSMRYVNLEDIYPGERSNYIYDAIRTLPEYVENTMRLF